MEDAFFASQRQAVMDAFVATTGCDRADFAREQLAIVPKPESYWPFVAMVVGFGAGTVACIEERFLAWFRGHATESHGRAGYLVLALAREAASRGEAVHAMPPMLGWAAAGVSVGAEPPPGYRLALEDRQWMQGWQARDLFQNALGHSTQLHRTIRNQFASVVFDDSDEPVAVAGAYDTAGLLEIGVDVKKTHRARGLASVVVSAATRAIVDQGKAPFYACEVTNVRSQRTALSSGFLPTLSLALAMPAGVGLTEDR